MTGFDEALRKREHEFRKQADEMSSTVLAHEMKVQSSRGFFYLFLCCPLFVISLVLSHNE